MPCAAHVKGLQPGPPSMLTPVPHLLGPPPPQYSPFGQLPHWIKSPQPSPCGPQVKPCCAQVFFAHMPLLASLASLPSIGPSLIVTSSLPASLLPKFDLLSSLPHPPKIPPHTPTAPPTAPQPPIS